MPASFIERRGSCTIRQEDQSCLFITVNNCNKFLKKQRDFAVVRSRLKESCPSGETYKIKSYSLRIQSNMHSIKLIKMFRRDKAHSRQQLHFGLSNDVGFLRRILSD